MSPSFGPHQLDFEVQIGLVYTAPFHVGPRNPATLSIQMDIPVPRVAHTHEAPGFEGECEPPLLTPPLKNRAETCCGLAIRPLDKDY